jgi:hypothetical protein
MGLARSSPYLQARYEYNFCESYQKCGLKLGIHYLSRLETLRLEEILSLLLPFQLNSVSSWIHFICVPLAIFTLINAKLPDETFFGYKASLNMKFNITKF